MRKVKANSGPFFLSRTALIIAYHLEYPLFLFHVSVDHQPFLVVAVGSGVFLVRVDIKEAYKMLPVYCFGQSLL